MINRVAISSFFLALSCASVAAAEPRNYDDCILESMKGVNSDFAAKMIAISCLNKFPRPSAVPANVLSRLTIDGDLENWPLSGSLENKTEDWIVTEVKIAVFAKRCVSMRCSESDVREILSKMTFSINKLDAHFRAERMLKSMPLEHVIMLDLEPQDDKEFTLPSEDATAPDIDLAWKIIGATGYRRSSR